MSKRVLVIDDSPTLRMAVKITLDTLGLEVVEAENGKLGVEALEKEKGNIDMILLDWFMPVMNGQETLEAIKSKDEYKHIPVVMLTTATDKHRMINAIRAGAKHYITKPFTEDLLLSRVVQTLRLE